jgi:hypothetical protein
MILVVLGLKTDTRIALAAVLWMSSLPLLEFYNIP